MDSDTDILFTGYRLLQLTGAGTHAGEVLPEPSGPLAHSAGVLLLTALARGSA